MKLFYFFILLLSFSSFSQIKTIEFVKIINNNEKEALYYYDNNWKILREIALKKKFIKSYSFLRNQKKENTEYDIILTTEYKDSIQFSKSEIQFQKIIKEKRPNGALLLNNIKPTDFKQNIYSSTFTEILNKKTNKK
jgi:hypothetical protein